VGNNNQIRIQRAGGPFGPGLLFQHNIQLVYTINTKAAFLDDLLFSSQLELFKYFSICSDWLDKGRPSKKATFVLDM